MMQNFQPYQPYPQPYQPAFQMPFQSQTSSLPGKVVDDFNNIGVNEVPMDGSASVFLKRDLSEIQVRKWGPDGRIYSTSYKAEELKNETALPQEDNFSNLNERLQAIEEKIDKLIKPTAKKVTSDANN